MMLTPRIVVVHRRTELDDAIARHGTPGQAAFFLTSRGRSIDELAHRHALDQGALTAVTAAIPSDWRRGRIERKDLSRFLFEADDVVVVVGQDGLVANVAKYLDGQPVLGLNPAPDLYDGVLVRISLPDLAALLPASIAGAAPAERRTMVEARLDTGERLLALNEVFVGHHSHQSARYRIATPDGAEIQSSSGLIVASGTGATGWARSIMGATHEVVTLAPEEAAVAYFVREPFPSLATGTTLRAGRLERVPLEVTSRMNDGGVIFADGIEQDFLAFDWGRSVKLGPALQTLFLVTG